MLPKIEIYTDGACSGNPGPGGWGALLIYNKNRKEIFGYQLETTNNQMEMMAAIEALKSLKKKCDIEIYTDSKYLMHGINEWIDNWKKNNWRKSDNKLVKNADLWQKLDKEIQNHQVKWYWVKGHGDNYGNNEADRLAVKGKAMAIKLKMEKNV